MSALRFAAISNDPFAEEAANEALLGGSSALAAVLSGFFASAGATSGVLLGPLSILVAGVGAGARAFDGRLLQPGAGTKRPRGFRDEDPVPDAAYVAVPNSVAAIAVAQAYDEERSFSAVVRPGIQRAQRAGAETRAELLKIVRGLGAAAFADPAFVRPLLHVAGASEGGLLTPTDLATVPSNIDVPASDHPAGGGWLEAPWSQEGATVPSDGPVLTGSGQMVAVAFDSRGTAAAVSYQRTRDGILIDAMELEAPRAAVPVLRGVTRVAPGERLPCAASMAVRFEGGRPVEIVTSPSVTRLEAKHLEAPQLALRRDHGSRLVRVTRQ